MTRILAALLCALLSVSPVYAGAGTITTKDAGGTTRTFDVVTDGSGNFNATAVICDQSAAANCAGVDASHNLNVVLNAEITKVIGTVNQGTSPWVVGLIYNSSAPSPSNGQSVSLQGDSAGRLIVALGASGVTQATSAASGQFVDGSIATLGAEADPACASDTGTCTLEALVKRNNQTLTSINTNVQAGAGATGSAPPAAGIYISGNGSGATGGLLTGMIQCDSHAFYDASDNGSITLITGVSGRKIHVCGYIMATGGTATNLKLVEGSNANCAANTATLTPAYQLVANDRIGFMSPFWTGLINGTAAYYICINASAGNAHQAEIWYSIL